ncbi:hypothetical protein ACJZ2D_010396 [Fusarium nematophilum]
MCAIFNTVETAKARGIEVDTSHFVQWFQFQPLMGLKGTARTRVITELPGSPLRQRAQTKRARPVRWMMQQYIRRTYVKSLHPQIPRMRGRAHHKGRVLKWYFCTVRAATEPQGAQDGLDSIVIFGFARVVAGKGRTRRGEVGKSLMATIARFGLFCMTMVFAKGTVAQLRGPDEKEATSVGFAAPADASRIQL